MIRIRSTRGRARLLAPLAGVGAALLGLAVGAGAAGAAGNACPSSNRPNELVLAGGSGQTAQLGKPFPAALQVALANTNGCPLTGSLAGVNVTFDAPGGGASGIFAGSGTHIAVVGTNAQGVATAPAFTANYTAGDYTVDAQSDYGTVQIYLTNTVNGLPSAIAATGTTSQEATVGGPYAQPLRARVTDAAGNPVQGATVSFSVAPGPTGAGASFLGGGQATATTGSDGTATSPPLLANGSAGLFTAAAAVDGVSTVATYTLDNHAAALALQAVSPTDSTAVVGSRYRQPLRARVLDAGGQPVEGASVTFALVQADGGAGATFLGGSTQAVEPTDSTGQAASPPFVADKTAGAFTATASTPGNVQPTSYALTNRAGAPRTLSAGAADGQSTAIGARFPVRLAVTVADENGNPVPGAIVAFTAPLHGAGGRFTVHAKKNARVVRVTTDSAGVAVAPPFTANGIAGGYIVAATSRGGAHAAFALMNTGRSGAP